MRFNYLKATLRTTAVAYLVLLLGALGRGPAAGQPDRGTTSITLPCTVVPMWGYTCGGRP